MDTTNQTFPVGPPRVAYFPDSFVEINGVAMTSRRFLDYAAKRNYPVLSVFAGRKNAYWKEGSIEYLSLVRSVFSFELDEELAFDPFFNRHVWKICRRLREFSPDIIHITGLNDVSITGTYLAWRLDYPLLGSWHTNLHEFAARRLMKLLPFLPQRKKEKLNKFTESKILNWAMLYYKIPKVVLSPNEDLVKILGEGTGRTSRLMARGVDTQFYSPDKRTYKGGKFTIGFVGRLRAEKNVRLLVQLENELISRGISDFRMLIVGEGTEKRYLEENLRTGEFTGFLEGEDLAEAYANMDVFVFPSETDAFGNVAQEALASGVPAIVTDKGGPKFFVNHSVTGFIAKGFSDFVEYTLKLLKDRELLAKMKKEARNFALGRSWDAVFDSVYDAYRETIRLANAKKSVSQGKKLESSITEEISAN
ncbi:MAG TPA: glycosyltransferase [Pyrinomonadaceae bacterium]|nr:glycosyltransferase [Pyrinomonadaceae bacterium]